MLTEDGCVSLRFSEKLTGYGAFWLYKILEKSSQKNQKNHMFFCMQL